MRNGIDLALTPGAPADWRGPGLDLLRLTPVRAVVLSPLFPYVIQAAILVLFVWLAVFGWGFPK